MDPIIEETETTEEIINPEVEETIEETVDESTEETDEVEEQEETEEEEFDPEKAQFKDDELYQIEGFDLSEFKEAIDLSNPETLQLAESQLKQLKDLGFTQEQIKFLVENAISDLQSEQTGVKELKTAREVNEYLNKNLEKETKLNYVPLTRNLKEWFAGSKYEKHYSKMVKDPDFLNLVNHLSKRIKGEPAGTGVKHETSGNRITAQVAKRSFNNFLASEKNTGLEAQRKEIARLENLCINNDEFKNEFVGLL